MIIARLTVALLSTALLTQCAMADRMLQVPMRTLGAFTRLVDAGDTKAMEQRAAELQQRPQAPQQQAEPQAASTQVAAR
jgi:hypothetical protein